MFNQKSRIWDIQQNIVQYKSWKSDLSQIQEENYWKFSNDSLIKLNEKLIIEAHTWQVNKVDWKPFHNHPIWVAKILSWYLSDDIDVITAWLAHDVIEDCVDWDVFVNTHFNKEVYRLVQWVTEIDKINSWEDRKDAYITHLDTVDTKILIVSLWDHMHNLHRLIWEYLELWEKLWENFWAKKDLKIQYFYKYANKLSSIMGKQIWNNYSKCFYEMYSDYIVLLDYFWDIIQKDIDINSIQFNFDEFITEYNLYSKWNGWTNYEEDEDSKYLVYDYFVWDFENIKEFAISIYKNEQEY